MVCHFQVIRNMLTAGIFLMTSVMVGAGGNKAGAFGVVEDESEFVKVEEDEHQRNRLI
jgi:hypothetical protein